MRVGNRVEDKVSHAEGVVVSVQYAGTSNAEARVRWDAGGVSWEMGEDLRVLPNRRGDAFLAMNNGFGVREGEIFVQIPDTRDNAATEAEMFLRERFGLLKVKHPESPSRERQLTLDIRARVAHGMPVKGGLGGKRPDERKLGLARVAATGEPVLVRKGKLWLTPRPPRKPRGDVLSSAFKPGAGKRLSRAAKRVLKAQRARRK